MRTTLALLAAMAISGCATQPEGSDADRAEAARPLLCANKQQCDVAWQRVQAWIAQNSVWRIQIANDVTIQTFGPANNQVDTAYSAVRTMNGDGTGAISVRAACNNVFYCRPEPSKAIASIKAYAAQ